MRNTQQGGATVFRRVFSWGDGERILHEVTSESRLKGFETSVMQRPGGRTFQAEERENPKVIMNLGAEVTARRPAKLEWSEKGDEQRELSLDAWAGATASDSAGPWKELRCLF